MTAREKFKIGGEVWLTKMAKRMNITHRNNAEHGVVRGFGVKTTLNVRVQVDGHARAETYHMDFWSHNPKE